MTRRVRTLTKGGYCDEDRAQVLALKAQGYGLDTISENTGVPRATCWDWICRYGNADAAELIPEAVRVARRGQALLHDYLNAVEESDEILKHGMTINAITGTQMDKVIKAQEPSHSNPTLVIVIPGIQEPVTIEGQVTSPSDQ